MRFAVSFISLLAALAFAGGPSRAAEERPPVKIPPGLRERLQTADADVRSQPSTPFPSFPGVRATTDYADVSTTGTAARLTELLALAQRTRTALVWWLGPGKQVRLNLLEQPLVFCRDVERRAWLKKLDLTKEELEWELNLAWNYKAGIHVVASEPEEGLADPRRARRATGSAASAFVQDFLRVVFPKWPAFCREGFRFVVCAAVNGTTMNYVVSRTEYDKTGRAPQGAALRVIDTPEAGPIFNPLYLTRLITQQKDDDLRLLLGKEYDTLTADDDVKSFFFVRWLLEEVDPQAMRVRAWFDALAAEPEDLDLPTRPLCPDVKGERVLEALDKRFREHHVREHPLPPHLQRDWTGTWAPTPETLQARNKEARRKDQPAIRSLRLDLAADGTWTETLDLDPGGESSAKGTWELLESGIRLKGKRHTGPGPTNLAFFRTRSLQEGDLVWQKK